MANDNETGAEAIFDLKYLAGELRLRSYLTPEEIHNLSCMITSDSDGIITAHKREIAVKDAKVAAKDREIAELTAIVNAGCRKCGECAKFGKDCTAGDIDGAEDHRACEQFVSKEVAELRERLKEALAQRCDAKPGFKCDECAYKGEYCQKWREAMKG